MNERLVLLRKKIGITQEEMGNKLGVTRAAISRLESGDRNLTEQMILSICRVFGVNEIWLRTGVSEMFIRSETFSLDEYAKNNNLTPLELDILKGYIELDKSTRHNLLSYFKSIFEKHSEIAATAEAQIDKEVCAYRQELEAEQKGQISLVSDQPKENLG